MLYSQAIPRLVLKCVSFSKHCQLFMSYFPDPSAQLAARKILYQELTRLVCQLLIAS